MNSKCVVAVKALVTTAAVVGEHAGKMNRFYVVPNQVPPRRGENVAQFAIKWFHAVS